MNKIYNELEYAENLIENGFSKIVSGRDLNILSKYYKSKGMNSSDIKKSIISLYEKWDKNFNIIIFEDKIDKVIKKSLKYELKIPIDVPITKNEVEKIRLLKNYRYEKIVFVMLVLAKHNSLTNKAKYDKYYFSGKLSAIYRIAKVSQMKNENIGHKLYKLGYIEDTQKKDNFKIMFTDSNDSSETEIVVNNMNCIHKFLKPNCNLCGKEIDKKSKKQFLCEDCYKTNEKERLRNFYINSRNKEQIINVERTYTG